MENKKLGMILIVTALIIGGIFVYYANKLSEQSIALGCFDKPNCFAVEKGLSISHFAIGVVAFILALGFYLLFFNKTEKVILEKLESEKNQKIKDIKFDIIMKALDPFEQKVMKSVREQDGITQNTLRLRVDMSKAKLSYVLQELEKRGLVKRVEKGKTLAVYLKI